MNSPQSLLHRIRQHWQLKLAVGVLLTVGFCAGYFSLQRFHLGSPRTLPLTTLDRWVPFSPGWAVVYQSMYLMLPLAWLAESREQLMRYVMGFVIVAAVGFSCFFFFPVIGPRPAQATVGLLAIVHSYDSPMNSMPSLHVALAVYSACFCSWAVSADWRMGAILAVWVSLIAYATMATRQHYFLDLPPGVLLGWLAHRAAGRMGPAVQQPPQGVIVGGRL